MNANQRQSPRTFQGIVVRGCINVEAGGGLVDLSTKAYREPWERKLCVTPEIARETAQALMRAADAAEGKSSAFDAAA